ncbi:MAG: histidine phosphatase family protein [Acidimicrobiia bacterium]
MTRLLVVRHGEAAGNRERRFIGQTDAPLTDVGRDQVKRLTVRLSELPITRVVSSDLQRAANTVAPAADLLGLEVHHDKRLREIANGEWADLVAEDVATRWPDLWSRYRDGEDVARPGGERWTDVQVRAVAAIEDLIGGLDGDDTVLIGTHAGPALGIIRWAVGLPPHGSVWSGPFGALHNTSISTISLPGPRLHTVNDTGHLATSEGLFV